MSLLGTTSKECAPTAEILAPAPSLLPSSQWLGNAISLGVHLLMLFNHPKAISRGYGSERECVRAEAVHASPVPVDFPADNFSDNVTVFPISKHWR